MVTIMNVKNLFKHKLLIKVKGDKRFISTTKDNPITKKIIIKRSKVIENFFQQKSNSLNKKKLLKGQR